MAQSMDTTVGEISGRSVIPAHRRVPTELWQIIFSTLCQPWSFRIDCDRDHMLEDDDDLISETPALALSHVCSRWRKIMEDSPDLWSSISILITHFVFDISVPLRTHFTNARDCPLDIRIVRLEDETFNLRDFEVDTWEIVSQHLPQCNRLSLRVLSEVDLPVPSDMSFPHLESLREDPFFGDKRGYGLWRAILLGTPRLTRLAVRYFDGLLANPSQLRSLDLILVANSDIPLLHSVLPKCTGLEQLSLRDCEDSDEVPTDLSPIQLSGSLRSLSIYDEEVPIFPDNLFLSTFLHLVTMPALTSFEFQCEDWPPSVDVLAERSPLLERVSLTIHTPVTTDPSSHSLFTFLQAFPCLKHLELRIGTPIPSSRTRTGYIFSAQLGDTFLDTVLSILEAERELPKLESLSIHLWDLTLESDVVERVLKVALKRQSMPSVTAPKEIRLVRVAKKAGAKFVLEPALTESVRQLGRQSGIRVVIEDGANSSEPPPPRDWREVDADFPVFIHV